MWGENLAASVKSQLLCYTVDLGTRVSGQVELLAGFSGLMSHVKPPEDLVAHRRSSLEP